MSVESVLCFKIENHELIHHCFGFAAVVSPVFTDLDLRAKNPSFPDPILLTHPPLNGSSFSKVMSNSSNFENFKKAQEKKHVGFVKTLRLPSSWHGMRKSHLRIRGYSQRSTCELFHLRILSCFTTTRIWNGRCWDGKVTQKAGLWVKKMCFLFRFQLEFLWNVLAPLFITW